MNNVAKYLFVLWVGLAVTSGYLILGRHQDRAPAAATGPTVEKRVRKLAGRVVPIKGRPDWTSGTGVLIKLPSNQTGVLTNAHVCKGVAESFPSALTVVDGQPVYDLMILKLGENVDLCLYISKTLLNHDSLKLKPQHNYPIGMELFMLGYPLNGPLNPQLGYYTARGRFLIAEDMKPGEECKGQVVPTLFGAFCGIEEELNAMTTITYPGNSGSPVFNDQDELVGLVNSSSGETHQGNFISGDAIERFLRGF